MFYNLIHIYDLKVKVLDTIGYSQEDSYLTKKLDPTMLVLNHLNGGVHAIHFLISRVKQGYLPAEHFMMVVDILINIAQSIQCQYEELEERQGFNFNQHKIPDEMYPLWKQYYYSTAIRQIPKDLLILLYKLPNPVLQQSHELFFYVHMILNNNNQYFDLYSKQFLTYEELTNQVRNWLTQYINTYNDSTFNITPQLVNNFPWNYKSLN